MKHYLLLFLLLPLLAQSQGSLLPNNAQAYHILDRFEILNGKIPNYHSSLKFYSRGQVMQFVNRIDSLQLASTAVDQYNLRYLWRENSEWLFQYEIPKSLAERRAAGLRSPIERSLDDPRYERQKPLLGFLYPSPGNMIEVNQPNFQLRVNPLLNLKYGALQNDDQPLFTNQRGVALRAGVDDRIYLYVDIVESQAQFARYVRRRIQNDQALPGNGLYKNYDADLYGVENGYDFLNSQGVLGFNVTPHVGIQLGYGPNKIGNGYRSVLLSDFSNHYLYLKLNWKVWKFHYQNIFAELSANSANGTRGSQVVPKKYMAAHHLSINLLPNLNVGLFEAVIFNREDQFEFQYLNPVIFYRAVEQGLGSPDNALLGADVKWNVLNRFQLYSQFILDEFVFDELFVQQRGWWANKFGWQVGLKAINLVPQLDLQVEYNLARPFTYSHFNEGSSYTHYNLPLSHPLGANFREYLLIARYQPLPRLTLEGRYIRTTFGENPDMLNFGSNLLLASGSRVQDFGNEIGQGIQASSILIGLDLSYQVYHDVFLDLHYFRRDKDSEQDDLDLLDSYLGCGVRINLNRLRFDF